MSDKKQTALEWLVEELDKFNKEPWKYVQKNGVMLGGKQAIIDKAKELEKQQIIAAYNQDLYCGLSGNKKFDDGEQYYEKNYE